MSIMQLKEFRRHYESILLPVTASLIILKQKLFVLQIYFLFLKNCRIISAILWLSIFIFKRIELLHKIKKLRDLRNYTSETGDQKSKFKKDQKSRKTEK